MERRENRRLRREEGRGDAKKRGLGEKKGGKVPPPRLSKHAKIQRNDGQTGS